MQLIQQNLPPVRNKAKRKKKKKKPEAENDNKQMVETRIGSYDYRSWDKFDAVSSWILSSHTRGPECVYVCLKASLSIQWEHITVHVLHVSKSGSYKANMRMNMQLLQCCQCD